MPNLADGATKLMKLSMREEQNRDEKLYYREFDERIDFLFTAKNAPFELLFSFEPENPVMYPPSR